MEILTQLLGWFEQVDAWLMAERWRWILAGAIQAGCWGACAFLLWRRSVERRARQMSGPLEPMIQFRAHLDDRATPALRLMGKAFRDAGQRIGASLSGAIDRNYSGKMEPVDRWPDPPAHPNCRSETPQADELERKILDGPDPGLIRFDVETPSELRRQMDAFHQSVNRPTIHQDRIAAEHMRKVDRAILDGGDVSAAWEDAYQAFRGATELDRQDAADTRHVTDLDPIQEHDLKHEICTEMGRKASKRQTRLHEQGKTSVPARPFLISTTGEATRPLLRPALEGVEIHEQAKRDKAEMVKGCASVGVTSDDASVAMGYLGRALQNSNTTVSIENELEERPRSIDEPGSLFSDMRPTGRSTTTMTIRGGDRIVVLKFSDVLDMHRFAKAFQDASEKGLASHIQIAWAWSKFDSRHANTSFGHRGWKGGVVVERRPGTPDAIRFRCGSYMMSEWGWDDPSNTVVRPVHGGECPECAKLDGPRPIYQYLNTYGTMAGVAVDGRVVAPNPQDTIEPDRIDYGD